MRKKEELAKYKLKRKPTPYELERAADALLECDKAGTTMRERYEEYPIETRNRRVTIDKRQTSLDAAMDSPIPIQQRMGDPRRRMPLVRKDKVHPSDPKVRERFEVIESLRRQQAETDDPDRKASLRQQETDEWKLVYELTASFHHPLAQPEYRQLAKMTIDENVWFDNDDMPHSDSVFSLLDATCVHFLLQNYYSLKTEVGDDFSCDMYYLLLDLEDVLAKVFRKDTEMRDVMLMKMRGMKNAEIQDGLRQKWGSGHSYQYISNMWCNKIPKLVVRQVQKEYVSNRWRDPNLHLLWKKCPKCGRLMPAHQLFFRKNGYVKGRGERSWYSTCKDCFNKGWDR